jgi:hypothetical protein
MMMNMYSRSLVMRMNTASRSLVMVRMQLNTTSGSSVLSR